MKIVVDVNSSKTVIEEPAQHEHIWALVDFIRNNFVWLKNRLLLPLCACLPAGCVLTLIAIAIRLRARLDCKQNSSFLSHKTTTRIKSSVFRLF